MLHFIDTGADIQVVQHDPSGYMKQLPAGVYEVSLTQEMNPRFCLTKHEKELHVPEKIYGDIEENVETIKKRYLNRPDSLGVLLTGTKGSGKSLISVLLIKEFLAMGKPVILVNKDWSERVGGLITFLSVFKECLVVFDEYEKYYNEYDQEQMLNFFDDKTKSHRLSVVIANEHLKITDFFFDRPSRFFYKFQFQTVSESLLEEYLVDNGLSDMIADFQYLRCNTTSFSYDVLQAIVDEIKLTGTKDLLEVLKYFNIYTFAFTQDNDSEVTGIEGSFPKFDLKTADVYRGDAIFYHEGIEYKIPLDSTCIVDYNVKTKEYTYEAYCYYKDDERVSSDLRVKVKRGDTVRGFQWRA